MASMHFSLKGSTEARQKEWKYRKMFERKFTWKEESLKILKERKFIQKNVRCGEKLRRREGSMERSLEEIKFERMLRSTEFERKEGKYFKRVKEEYWKYSDGGKYRRKFDTKSEVQKKGCMEAHRDVQNYNRWDVRC